MEWVLGLSRLAGSSREGFPEARGQVSPRRSLLLPLTHTRKEGEEVIFLCPYILPGTETAVDIRSNSYHSALGFMSS